MHGLDDLKLRLLTTDTHEAYRVAQAFPTLTFPTVATENKHSKRKSQETRVPEAKAKALGLFLT